MSIPVNSFLTRVPLPLPTWSRRPPENTTTVSHVGVINKAQELVRGSAAEAEDDDDLEAGLLVTSSHHQILPRLDLEQETSTDQQELTRESAGTGHLVPLQLQQQSSENQNSGKAERAFTSARKDQRSNAKLKEHLTLSFLVITIAVGVLVNLFFVRTATEPISKIPSLIVASAFAFVSLISGVGFMIDTMREMSRERILPMVQNNPPRSWYKVLVFMSLMSLVFTVLALVASSLPKTYCYLPVVLLPALPIVGIAVYDVVWSDDGHVVGSANNHDPHKATVQEKADRKRSVQLSVSMTTFSFMGSLGAAIGYQKNSSNIANPICVKISIYFMIGAAVAGLVTLLLNGLKRIQDWRKIAVSNIIMLGLVVPSALIIAETFLGGVLGGTAFPVATALAIWYFMEHHVPHNSNGDDGGVDLDKVFAMEAELKPLYTVALTATSVSFGALMALFSGILGGGEGKGKNVEVSVFSVVSCFLSSLSLGIITFRSPTKASVGATARALVCLTLVLLMLAALALVSYVG